MLLYLHIPFCDSKCFYCAFCSYVGKDHLQEVYLEAILKQFDMEAQKFDLRANNVETLFVGGGTPSTLEARTLKPFMDKIAPYLSSNAEITTEANPNSATLAWLEQVRELRFNRISFGVQSFNDKKLKFLGRIHNHQEAKNAVLNARKVGFKNISLDLMYGVKPDTKKLLDEDIAIASSLPINHISAYSLSIEKNSKFYTQKDAQRESLALAKHMINSLNKHGFYQYEISNFSRDYECRHNKLYWEQKDYIGIGCGAVGFYKNRRFYPSKNLKNYIKNPLSQKIENLSENDLLLERIFLSLRSNVGLELKNLPISVKSKIDILVKEKKGVVKEDRFYNLNYLVADEMALFLSD